MIFLIVLALLTLTNPGFSQNQQDALSLLITVSETYQRLPRYYVEGTIVVEIEMTAEGSRIGKGWKPGETSRIEVSLW